MIDVLILTFHFSYKVANDQGAGIDIEIGQYNSNKEDIGEFTVFSERYWLHPEYRESDDGIPQNDVCVIRVPSLTEASPADCDGCFETVCLADNQPTPGAYCWIAGWGSISATSGKNFFSNKLRDAGVNIFSRDYCLKKTFYEEGHLSHNMFCAGIADRDGDGESDGGVDACQVTCQKIKFLTSDLLKIYIILDFAL